jgi:hypothetical protein
MQMLHQPGIKAKPGGEHGQIALFRRAFRVDGDQRGCIKFHLVLLAGEAMAAIAPTSSGLANSSSMKARWSPSMVSF